jgi:hypothetical protein
VSLDDNSVDVRSSRIYSWPEKSVRRELTKLAEEKLIRLAGWDGRERRPFTAWRTVDEFINSSLGAGHVHVDLWDSEQFYSDGRIRCRVDQSANRYNVILFRDLDCAAMPVDS